MKTLSLIFPVYYNEASIPDLYEGIKNFDAELARREMKLELILVNDGSGDNSQLELLKIKEDRPATKLIQHTRNFGATAASKTGFKFVTGDCFLVQSADLQDPLEQVLKMVDEWLNGAKYVISVRAGRKDPIMSKIFSALYYVAIRALVIGDYPKGGFDLMLSDAEILPYLLQSDRHVNVNIYTYSLGFKPTVLSYQRLERKHGRSRWTFRKKFNHMVNTFTGFTGFPIRIFSLIGMFTALVSFVYGAHIFYSALMHNVSGSGFATVVVLLSFFSGMILMMLGVLGEYIYRTFERTGHRPESVIGEVLL